jgi:CRISPR/Cas system-associated endonuclease Cas1
MMTNLANRLIQWTPPEDSAGVMSTVAETFRGQEGTASRLYFDQIAAFLEGKIDFLGRMKRPAFLKSATLKRRNSSQSQVS